MTLIAALDWMVRGGAIALLALWSWILFRDHREALAARLAVAMNAAIVCHVVVTGTLRASAPGLDIMLQLGSAAIPGLFWLFARAWFNDERKIGWASWALVLLSLVNLLILLATFDRGGTIFRISVTLFRIGLFAFAGAGLWAAWKGREGDLVESRRRFRVRLVVAVGLFAILTNLVEMLAFGGFLPREARGLIEVGILILAYAFCAAMFGIRQADLFASVPAAVATPLPKQHDDDPLRVRLLDHMERDRPYRDETLTIAALARQLDLQEYRLRRLINGALGHRNFAAFLNRYRLDEVRAALADPAQREVPILTIALDAGFGSLGPFNRAFREAEGMTPSEYRAAREKSPR